MKRDRFVAVGPERGNRMNAPRGFTLIELMIVIAIIAILAAIAVPAYQDYVVRAKLIEGFSGAMGVKAEIGSAYMSGGSARVAVVAEQYQPANTSTRTKYVKHIEVSDAGVITAVIAANAANGLPSGLDGQTFTLTPQVSTSSGFVALAAEANGRMDWACASSSHVVAEARAMLYTEGTLPGKYLPAECR